MKKLSKQFWLTILGICIIFVIVMTAAIVLFMNREEKVVEQQEEGGSVYLNYSSNVSGLSIKKATPTTDAVGIKNMKNGEYFDFSIEVKLDNATSVEYEVVAIKDKTSTIKDDDIRIYLEKEKSGTYTKVLGPAKFSPISEKSKLGSPVGSMILASAKKINSTPDNYRLRMWLSDKSVMPDGDYSIEIAVNGIAK